jgi:hypothetical protein
MKGVFAAPAQDQGLNSVPVREAADATFADGDATIHSRSAEHTRSISPFERMKPPESDNHNASVN